MMLGRPRLPKPVCGMNAYIYETQLMWVRAEAQRRGLNVSQFMRQLLDAEMERTRLRQRREDA